MAHDHWDQVLRRDIQAQQFCNLQDPVRDLRLLIKDELVDDLSEDFLDERLDFGLYANDQVIELVEGFLFQVDFQRELFEVFQYCLN